MELATVFIGVYAAFFLSYRASQRQSYQRREQLLTWVEEYYTQLRDNAREQTPRMRQAADEFKRRSAAGETPPVHPMHWRSDYEASDTISVLQSGGYDLLDIATVRDMRDTESTIRSLVAVLTRAQRLSDETVLPNADKGTAFFYDPTTRQLRESYAWYPETFETVTSLFEELQPKVTTLLEQVRAERRRGR